MSLDLQGQMVSSLANGHEKEVWPRVQASVRVVAPAQVAKGLDFPEDLLRQRIREVWGLAAMGEGLASV